jgi:hypothetical protein
VAPVKKRVKRIRKTLDYYNVIQALPAMFPFPPKKMEPHAAGKKRVTTDEYTTGGPSSKYPPLNHSKKEVWNNASMCNFIPGVCMKKWKLKNSYSYFFSKTKSYSY